MWFLKRSRRKELKRQLEEASREAVVLNHKIDEAIDDCMKKHAKASKKVIKTIVENHFKISVIDSRTKGD